MARKVMVQDPKATFSRLPSMMMTLMHYKQRFGRGRKEAPQFLNEYGIIFRSKDEVGEGSSSSLSGSGAILESSQDKISTRFFPYSSLL